VLSLEQLLWPRTLIALIDEHENDPTALRARSGDQMTGSAADPTCCPTVAGKRATSNVGGRSAHARLVATVHVSDASWRVGTAFALPGGPTVTEGITCALG
jgi:hypothetical protein